MNPHARSHTSRDHPEGHDPSATKAANASLRRIWAEAIASGCWPPEIPQRWPMQYPDLEPNRLLFVGLNPSYTVRARERGDDVSIGHPAELEDPKTLQQRLSADAHWRRSQPYFRPFTEFHHPWEHIDIFAVRERDQAKVSRALCLDRALSPFAKRQWQVFEDLLAAVRPVGVVVVSALASTLLSDHWNGSGLFTPGEHLGRGTLQIGKDIVPLFFAGMLSGQRAMDRFSRARLVHEVRQGLGDSQGQGCDT